MFELTSRPLLDTATSRQIDVAGEMDLFAASALRRALEGASTIGVDLIHVDLSSITWVNGSALRHVANTRRRMWDLLDVDLDLVSWSAAVMRMSTRARLDGVLGRVA
jgi:anti-anti-sigma regulatory factor